MVRVVVRCLGRCEVVKVVVVVRVVVRWLGWW